ncbi:MAG: hypothetical protein OHK0012_18410 [Synechococcales cyanobacterium]
MLFMQETDPVGILNWLGTLLLLAIPVVNLITIVVILINPNGRASKKNFVLASLILFVIALVLSLILVATVLPSLMEALQEYPTAP